MFRGLERDPSDVRSLVRFHVFLWTFIQVFCNYLLCYVDKKTINAKVVLI